MATMTITSKTATKTGIEEDGVFTKEENDDVPVSSSSSIVVVEVDGTWEDEDNAVNDVGISGGVDDDDGDGERESTVAE